MPGQDHWILGHVKRIVWSNSIVARCAEAMGGANGIETLRTLRFQLSSPNRLEPVLWEIARPNYVRKERAGDILLAFDGKRAAFLQAHPNEEGTPREPHVVDQADWHHFEMDIALYVPAFFDYPATYVDTTSVDGSVMYLLRVNLPIGDVAEYTDDAEIEFPIHRRRTIEPVHVARRQTVISARGMGSYPARSEFPHSECGVTPSCVRPLWLRNVRRPRCG